MNKLFSKLLLSCALITCLSDAYAAPHKKTKAKAPAKATAQTVSTEKAETASPAKAPTLKINGFTVVNASTVSQRQQSGGKGGGIPGIGIGVSDLYFTAEGKSAEGVTYKYRMNINAVPFAQETAVDRNFIEVGHDKFGTTQFGAVGGVEDSMSKAGLTLIGGAAGMDGTFAGNYNMSSGVTDGVHIYGYTKRANKISYITPNVSGFQVGVSFTPNTSNAGRLGPNFESQNKPGIGNQSGIYPNKDYAAFGLANTAIATTYSNTWDQLSLQLAAIYVMERSRLKGDTQQFKVNNLSAYQLSATVGYGDIRFATSFTDNGKSRLPKDANCALKAGNAVLNTSGAAVNTTDLNTGDAGKAWDFATQYTMGAYQFAAGYFETVRKVNTNSKARFQIVTLTADWNALPGLKFFAEADVAKSGNTQAAVNQANGMGKSGMGRNSGNTFIVGSKVSF